MTVPKTLTLKDAEVRKLLAEETSFLAEAKRADLEARNYLLKNEAIERELHKARSEAENFNEYMFYNPVVEPTVAKAMHDLELWARQRPGEPMVVTFNSPGGLVTDGFALYDFLRDLSRRGHHITTRCIGMAASMGAILMQAGDDRVMTPNAYLMIHEISGGAEGKLSEMEDVAKVVKAFQDRALTILTNRSNMSKNVISAKWKKRDWYMDAPEALRQGFIDRVEE